MSSSRSFTCSQLWTTKLHHARKNWTDQFSCWCRATRWTMLHDWLNKQQNQKQKQKETKTKIQSGNQKWTKANKHKSKINNKWKNILAIHVDNVCNIPIREVTRCRQIEQPTNKSKNKNKRKQKKTKEKTQSGKQKWTKASKHKSKINNSETTYLQFMLTMFITIPIREVSRCRLNKQQTKAKTKALLSASK